MYKIYKTVGTVSVGWIVILHTLINFIIASQIGAIEPMFLYKTAHLVFIKRFRKLFVHCTVYHKCAVQYTTFVLYSIPHLCCTVYHIRAVQYTTYVQYSIPHSCCTVYHICVVQFITFVLYSWPHMWYSLPHTCCTIYHICVVQFTTCTVYHTRAVQYTTYGL